MPVCNYDYNPDNQKLRLNCLGCLFGSSIEDYEACMARVIDNILQVKRVSSIILAREREYEYSPEQTKMLVEIADVIEEAVRSRIVSLAGLGLEKCSILPSLVSKTQYIVLDLLRKDPIGAYVEIEREIRESNIALKKEMSVQNRRCYQAFREVALEVLKARLEKTGLIQSARPYIAGYHIGDRSAYRQIFNPMVRPNFMLTRYMITPPEKAKSIEKYKVGDFMVEIFRVHGSAEYFYYVLPPEFRLSDEKYTVLDAARRYMATHRPKTAEFVRSDRVRESFYNIGKDMIRETAEHMSIYLSSEELAQLASILARYTAGMGVLDVLIADEKIQDIYVNSPIDRQPIMISHADYEECKTNLIPTTDDAEGWATRLRIESGRPLDEANPVLDTDVEVPGGRARFCVITKSLSPMGLGFAIRRHRDKPWTMPLFMRSKMINPMAAGLLSFLVDGMVSILVAGGRGAGKTSMLSSLMLEMLPKTRQVVIQDTMELPIEQMIDLKYNIESLKSRSVLTMVQTEMSADEALRTSLRLGDSALIVGEIRSTEAKVLWEAMRIGALSNVVAGTIHGESPYGVYDRVVNDLGVPSTSFKATDIISICRSLRTADGLHRYRRMTEITEVRKGWEENPRKEGGFIPLMEYSAKEDTLKPTDTLVNGESEILNRIASNVKEWSGNWDTVWENIKLRAKIKKTVVEIAEKSNHMELLEADWTTKSNAFFHIFMEESIKESGVPDAARIYDKWLEWFKAAAKEKP
jgi:type IV secretory pathway ATPase VirB11/archaellum biosynthesis ATPase